MSGYTQTILLMITLIAGPLASQDFNRLNVPCHQDGHDLKFPLTGGLRAGQFSNIDLNQDGTMDLFVFDRNGDVILPFVKTGAPGSLDYRFAPEYITSFPSLRNWALLTDFNGDGVEDIFASSSVIPACIEVWRGMRDNAGRLSFKMVTFGYGMPEILQFPVTGGYTQIYASNIDLPAIADMDGDGDVDILSFEPDGSYASFYRNLSIDKNLGLDTLIYERGDICWGKFAENQFNEDIYLSSNPFSCADGFHSGGNTGARHSGSTLTALDGDEDGDMDLLIGDLASLRIKYLSNGGTLSTPFITSLDISFPSYDVPADMDIFLGAYHADVNADGKRDLIITPNDINSGQNENHVWLYLNEGTDAAPIFRLNKKDFLIDEMLNFNSGSHPAFADVNADGLQDLVIGTNGIYRRANPRLYRMILMLNKGTATSPVFEVTDGDYLGFSGFGEETGRYAPTFGDIDNDGDTDLMVGDSRGVLYLSNNKAGPGQPYDFDNPVYKYADISLGQNAKPAVSDMNGDSLIDLLIGEKNNQLNFFKNSGTAPSPVFNPDASQSPNTDNAGKIFTGNDFATQNGAPAIFSSEGKKMMLLGTEDADLMLYDQLEDNVYSSFNLAGLRTGGINEGRKVTPALADIDGDGYYELALGNERGGLTLYNTPYKASPSSGYNPAPSNIIMDIIPNPASDRVLILTNTTINNVFITDIAGRFIPGTIYKDTILNLPNMVDGIYFLHLCTDNGTATKKLVISTGK